MRTFGASLRTLAKQGKLTVENLEAMRHILLGGSVVDWKRLNLVSDEAIRQFLKANEYDVTDGFDVKRLEDIYTRAVHYLQTILNVAIPDDLTRFSDPLLPFRLASDWTGNNTLQRFACVILKVMHVLNYMDGKELRQTLPISDSRFSAAVSRKIIARLTEVSARGVNLSHFSGGFKIKDSIITKLLLRKENIAVPVFDRIRYRFVTRESDEIIPLLLALVEALMPFNYVVPGQTSNNLLDLEATLGEDPALSTFLPLLQTFGGDDRKSNSSNNYSARSYQGLNFIVDMPLRVETTFPEFASQLNPGLGRIVFFSVEFQILDEITNERNEHGESSHEKYKERQRHGALLRLGLNHADTTLPKDKPEASSITFKINGKES